MSIPAIEPVGGFTPMQPLQIDPDVTAVRGAAGPQGVSGAQSVAGTSFGSLLADKIEGLEAMNDRTDDLAVQATTGDLKNIHDYTIAAAETQMTTQLTVAMRNKAVEAFTEIMRTPIG
ncbi:flagellar hook-basal body complex protein FliE [Aeromicrobium sp. IC_218]|uniref:flagellar hook-basal body complex protein FliE n=1 Tax=Aeromicrobium sp. IC_218 TaxID=2545468 RepID=UPI00103CA04B|nr:flagellar hook-basal body complex protein FliE [Aeromicrobium sp. IC_218]TCJ00529.1 flagellar hook-basal body protein FliE [Aeromicrobium sp. IC_218]